MACIAEQIGQKQTGDHIAILRLNRKYVKDCFLTNRKIALGHKGNRLPA
jgi:hypothetical protein